MSAIEASQHNKKPKLKRTNVSKGASFEMPSSFMRKKQKQIWYENFTRGK